jgi:hypothetical protein
MKKEDVIKFLEENLEGNSNRVGIEMSTDGDPGGDVGLYCELIYNFDWDDEVYPGKTTECSECDGNGEIEGYSYDDSNSCSECDGSGEIEQEDDDLRAEDVIRIQSVSKEEVINAVKAMLGL